MVNLNLKWGVIMHWTHLVPLCLSCIILSAAWAEDNCISLQFESEDHNTVHEVITGASHTLSCNATKLSSTSNPGSSFTFALWLCSPCTATEEICCWEQFNDDTPSMSINGTYRYTNYPTFQMLTTQHIINNATETKSGEYHCAAMIVDDDSCVMHVPITLISQLTVQDERKPSVEIYPREVNLKEGDSLTLTCNVTGFPTPVISWYRGKDNLKKHSREYNLTNINERANGDYWCSASNKLLHGKIGYGESQRVIVRIEDENGSILMVIIIAVAVVVVLVLLVLLLVGYRITYKGETCCNVFVCCGSNNNVIMDSEFTYNTV